MDERREIFLRDMSELYELKGQLKYIETEIDLPVADSAPAEVAAAIKARRDKLRGRIAELKARLGIQQ